MPSNIKLTIEYNGRNYCGWQSQDKAISKKPSIQKTIERALSKILIPLPEFSGDVAHTGSTRGAPGEKINLAGSGRTDSGVHALGQVANFKSASKLPPEKIKLALNSNLPKSIRVLSAERVDLSFHSRFSAKSKIYRYIILNQNFASAIFGEKCYLVKFALNVGLMKQAAKYLEGRHDFKAFCSTGSSNENTTRSIHKISIQLPNQIFLNDISSYKYISIDIEADGFLYNMVRNIVGTLIEVGRGKILPQQMAEILKSKKRSLCGPCVPAKGLYLCSVQY